MICGGLVSRAFHESSGHPEKRRRIRAPTYGHPGRRGVFRLVSAIAVNSPLGLALMKTHESRVPGRAVDFSEPALLEMGHFPQSREVRLVVNFFSGRTPVAREGATPPAVVEDFLLCEPESLIS